jgi:pyruvate carboxylase subunit B
MTKYVVRMDGKDYVVTVDADGLVAVEGVFEHIDIRPLGNDTFAVLLGNRSTSIALRSRGNSYDVLVGCHQIEARVESEREKLLREYATESSKGHHRYEIRAPMPALVTRVEVHVGDSVSPGQGLVVLEAMKMENEIRAHQAGTVKEVHVAQGSPVEKGELLILLE